MVVVDRKSDQAFMIKAMDVLYRPTSKKHVMVTSYHDKLLNMMGNVRERQHNCYILVKAQDGELNLQINNHT